MREALKLEIQEGNQCCRDCLGGLLFSEAQLEKLSCIRPPEPTIQVAYEWHEHKCKHKHEHGKSQAQRHI